MEETEVIAKTDDLRVRIMALSPYEIADWHYHTQVTDHIFCLTGPSGSGCEARKQRFHWLPVKDAWWKPEESINLRM